MIHPDLHPFLAEWERRWADLPQPAAPAARRAHFERVALAMRETMPAGVRADEEHRVPVPANGQAVRVRVFRPATAGPLPALVYLHGGAWMIGSPETHWDITAQLAERARVVVISVDYALAPERPFPAAVHEVQAVLEWAQASATALGLRADALAVGGDSAGGNLAAVAALRCRGTPLRLRAQWLVYPATDFSLDRPSHRENADGPLVTVASMPAVNAAYCPDPAQLTDPMAAPLRATSHAGLPPAFVAVAEHDPLRDEGIAYAEALRAAGVPVQLDRGPGLIHGYLRAMAWCGDARASFHRMADWVGAQLHR